MIPARDDSLNAETAESMKRRNSYVGIARVDQDARDVARLVEAHVPPRRTALGLEDAAGCGADVGDQRVARLADDCIGAIGDGPDGPKMQIGQLAQGSAENASAMPKGRNASLS